MEDADNISINLNAHFSDPDEPEAILTYEITGVSDPSVANLTIASEVLSVNFLAQGH